MDDKESSEQLALVEYAAAPQPVRRRKRLEYRDPATLSDDELLAEFIGAGLVCEVDGAVTFRDLLNAAESCSLPQRARQRLDALLEAVRRFGERPFRTGEPFRGSGDVYAQFRERLGALKQEVFIAVLLDNKHRKIRDVEVSRGSLTASIVHPRDVFLPVVRYSAAAVVFVHNHPSGDPTPSKEDIEITRRLREVGDIMGVRVLDHIVIGAGRYVSFVDDGYW